MSESTSRKSAGIQGMGSKPALIAFLMAAACAAPGARAEAGPQFRDLKTQALGNTGTASASGAASLFLNPAGLAENPGGNLGLHMDLGLNSVLLDYAKWATDNYDLLTKMDTLLTKIQPIDNKWAPFSQAVNLHGRWEEVAFSVVSDLRYDLTVAKAVVTPVIGVGALADLVLTAGRAFHGPDGYDFGFALKYLYRVRFDRRLMGTTDDAFYKVKDAWEKKGDSYNERVDKLQVAEEIAKTSHGVGINLGARKAVSKNWSAGFALVDFPTVLDAAFLRPDINLGLAWHDDLEWFEGLPTKGVVNLDFQRFLLPGTPWYKQVKLGTGIEGYLGKRPVGFLAMGLNDGYPTFGVRFGYILYFSYIYVAEEIGTYPGQEILSFHKLSLDLEL